MNMENELEYYGGNGYLGVPEYGRYKVKAKETKKFVSLTNARKYYDSLNEEKALWDLSGAPELLECHTVKS
jgi:hypothetical protein